MAVRKIRIYGDPVLRKMAEPVEAIDDEIRELAADMLETMYANNGVGLAANQVGVLRRIIVVDTQSEEDDPGPKVFINPVIRNPKGAEVMEEGCLSIPDIRADVKRAKEFDFEALDLDGNRVAFHADGLLARIILHEVDHLNGRLFVDYLSPVKKMMLKDQLKKLEQKALAMQAA
jgi:peptide deformylase